MSPTHDDPRKHGQLSLAELLSQYLQRQTVAQAEGLGYAISTEEVVPHEAVPVQPVDPRQAWEDAVAVLPYLSEDTAKLPVPADWPALVASQEPALAVPFCLGNYPQLVRHLHALLASDLEAPGAMPQQPMACPALQGWARARVHGTSALAAAAALRLAGHFEQAASVLESAEVPPSWQLVRSNEEAALMWHRGQAQDALARWEKLQERAPVLFNRGVALLFLGQAGQARTALRGAVALLPETSAWHHLGQLYLALANARR